MKHLNVKWVCEPLTIFSLAVAASPDTPATLRGEARLEAAAVNTVPCTRIIVISEKSKLKADVLAEQVSSPGAA